MSSKSNQDIMAEHPCWCGRPSVEIYMSSNHGEELETRGYCERHCEQSKTTVTHKRQDRPNGA